MPIFNVEIKCSHCDKSSNLKVETRTYDSAESAVGGALINGGWRFVMGDFTLCPECAKEFDDLLARQVDEHREFVHGDKNDPRWPTRKTNVQIMSVMHGGGLRN